MDLHGARAAVLEGALAPWRWPRVRTAREALMQRGVFLVDPEVLREETLYGIIFAAVWNPGSSALSFDPFGRGLPAMSTRVPPGHVVWAFEGMNPMPVGRPAALSVARGLLAVCALSVPRAVTHDVVYGAHTVYLHIGNNLLRRASTSLFVRDQLAWPASLEFDATEVMPVQYGTCMEDARALEAAARARAVTRCRRFKEELMQVTWHPRRLAAWHAAGGEPMVDMMMGI